MSIKERFRGLFKVVAGLERAGASDESLLDIYETRTPGSLMLLLLGSLYLVAMFYSFVREVGQGWKDQEGGNLVVLSMVGILGWGLVWAVKIQINAILNLTKRAHIVAGKNFIEKKYLTSALWEYLIWEHVSMVDVHAMKSGRFKVFLYGPGKKMDFVLKAEAFRAFADLAKTRVVEEKWSDEAKKSAGLKAI